VIDFGTLIGEGFAFGMVVYFTVWGLLIPFRWLVRMLGL